MPANATLPQMVPEAMRYKCDRPATRLGSRVLENSGKALNIRYFRIQIGQKGAAISFRNGQWQEDSVTSVALTS
jgi:hypothetical protein